MDGDGNVKLKMEMFFWLLLLMWQELRSTGLSCKRIFEPQGSPRDPNTE